MGIKKIARPINKAKNDFVKWLKENKAEDIDVYACEDNPSEWDYYRNVTAFIGETLYMVCFKVWQGDIKIDYSDGENRYGNLSVEDFLQLIN